MALQIPVPPIPGPGGVAGVVGEIAGAAVGAAGGAVSKIPGVDLLGDVADTARAVRAWVSNRHNWVRVSWFVGGTVMFTVGAVMLGERPIANATNAVVKPVGSVIKSSYKG